MKLTKHFYTFVLAASVLSGCNQNENQMPVNSESKIETPEVNAIKKHAAVNLPVNVYVDSNYKIEGQQVKYSRSITKVAIQNFDEATEIEFLDRYGNAVRSQGFDLQNEYKLLVITMKQEVKEEARSRPREAFMFNEGSGLVIGDSNLSIQNEFLRYQEEFLTKDFKVGRTFDETGKILMAIPKDYANDQNLQLRINQDIEGEKKYIYIDVN